MRECDRIGVKMRATLPSVTVVALSVVIVIVVGCATSTVTVRSLADENYEFTGRERVFMYRPNEPTDEQEQILLELKVQLEDAGFVLVDSLASADVVLMLHFLAESPTYYSLYQLVDGSEYPRVPSTLVASTGTWVLQMRLFRADEWVDTQSWLQEYRMSGRNIRPSPIWVASIEPRVKSFAYKQRLNTYIDLLLSVYGKTALMKRKID